MESVFVRNVPAPVCFVCPVPALPLEAGFQGGAAPLGVSQRKAAMETAMLG